MNDYSAYETHRETPTFQFALREDIKEFKTFLPTQAEPKATGYDVRAAINESLLSIKPFDFVKIPLGFRALCPEGWWFELKPRSSSFAKKYLHCLYGTIDECYEGELVLACQYIPPVSSYIENYPLSWNDYLIQNTLHINFGDAVGQIIPVRRQEMKVVELSNTEIDVEFINRNSVRGTGGFGSSDK